MFDFDNGDINILLSMVNLKLRDEFESIVEFSKYYDIDLNKILNKFSENGYFYDEINNQFKRK